MFLLWLLVSAFIIMQFLLLGQNFFSFWFLKSFNSEFFFFYFRQIFCINYKIKHIFDTTLIFFLQEIKLFKSKCQFYLRKLYIVKFTYITYIKTNILIYTVIITMFQPLCPQAFSWCLSIHITYKIIPLFNLWGEIVLDPLATFKDIFFGLLLLFLISTVSKFILPDWGIELINYDATKSANQHFNQQQNCQKKNGEQ